MDDVRVHYNSSKPATVQALAYTQGTDIHVAPGQEKHLPHEAWHVAQQMAGRVSPTTNINGMPVNDNAALEHEADVMGEKAVTQMYKDSSPLHGSICKNTTTSVFQCVSYNSIDDVFTDVLQGYGLSPQQIVQTKLRIYVNMNKNPNLLRWFQDACRNLRRTPINSVPVNAEICSTHFDPAQQSSLIEYEHGSLRPPSAEMLCVLVLHELMHVDSAMRYQAYTRNSGYQGGQFLQSHVDSFNGPNIVKTDSEIVTRNIATLKALWKSDLSFCNNEQRNWINDRIRYMKKNFFMYIQNGVTEYSTVAMEYDTILGDLVYYMISQNLKNLKTYHYANKLLAEANERRNNPGQAARVIKPKNHFWQFWR